MFVFFGLTWVADDAASAFCSFSADWSDVCTPPVPAWLWLESWSALLPLSAEAVESAEFDWSVLPPLPPSATLAGALPFCGCCFAADGSVLWTPAGAAEQPHELPPCDWSAFWSALLSFDELAEELTSFDW